MSAIINWVNETTSTNSLLASQAGQLASGAVIAARRQSAGRGQRGNSWESEPYKNLTFSMLLKPQNVSAPRQFELSMAVALAICESLQKACGEIFKVKWPNDIYHDDKKICGILIENTIERSNITRSIIGAGINVNQQQFFSDAPNPVSLLNITGRETDLEPLLQEICDNILTKTSLIQSPDNSQVIKQAFVEKMWRYDGQYHLWQEPDATLPFRAKIADVDLDGRLSLEDSEGHIRKYYFKEVAAVL